MRALGLIAVLAMGLTVSSVLGATWRRASVSAAVRERVRCCAVSTVLRSVAAG